MSCQFLLRRKSTIITGAALLLWIVIFSKEINAKKPIILSFPARAFASTGTVSSNGRVIVLTGTGTARMWRPSEQAHITVTVVQPHTGAKGFGIINNAPRLKTIAGAPVPPSASSLVRVHALPGSPSFGPGQVLAHAKAVHLFRGKIIGGWNWNSSVILTRTR